MVDRVHRFLVDGVDSYSRVKWVNKTGLVADLKNQRMDDAVIDKFFSAS